MQGVAEFSLPSVQARYAPTFLDPVRKLFITVVSQDSDNIHIFVFNWEIGESYIFDLNVSFVGIFMTSFCACY